MRLFVQAIITGIGLKLGADIYKYIKAKAGIFGSDQEDESLQQAGGAQTSE